MRKLAVVILMLMLSAGAFAQIPKEDLKRIKSSVWMAEYSFGHDDYQEVKRYSENVVNIYENNNFPVDKYYSVSGAYLAIAFTYLGDHETALRVFNYLLSRSDIYNYFDDKVWALTFLAFAESNVAVGKYAMAEEYCHKLELLVNDKFAKNKLLNFLANNEYGYAFLCHGEYQKSIPYFEKALDISMSIKNGYQQQTSVLTNLGLSYYYSSEFAKSLECLTKCRQIYDACNFDKKYQHMLYQNLGLTHLAMGDYKNAFDDFEIAQDCAEKYFGDTSQYYADVIMDISIACSRLNEYSIARDMLDEAISIMENIDCDSSKLAVAYDNQASLLYVESKYHDAFQYSNKSMEIISKCKSLNSTDYWISKNRNWWFRFADGGKVSLTEIMDCIDSTAKYLGRYNAVTIQALNNIVNYRFAFPDVSIDDSLFERYVSDNVDMIDLQLSQYTEKERQMFWNNWNGSVNTWDMALNIHSDRPEGNAILYNFVLWSKGMLLNNNSIFTKRVSLSDDYIVYELDKKLSEIKINISNLESTPKGSHNMDINALYSKRDSIEHLLVKKLSDNQIFSEHIDFKELKSYLGDNDLAVEFVTYLKIGADFRFANTYTYGRWCSGKIIPSLSIMSCLMRAR